MSAAAIKTGGVSACRKIVIFSQESTLPRFLLLLLAITSAPHAWGEIPVPVLPQAHVNTSWNPPAGGRIWRPHQAAELQRALDSSSPGDKVILDAGAIYQGNFTVAAKANPGRKWIYIESSDLAKLPAPGKRVDPAMDAEAGHGECVAGNQHFAGGVLLSFRRAGTVFDVDARL